LKAVDDQHSTIITSGGSFINCMLDGDNAADVFHLIGAGNPAIFPGLAETQKLQMLRDFDVHSRRLMPCLWTEIKVR